VEENRFEIRIDGFERAIIMSNIEPMQPHFVFRRHYARLGRASVSLARLDKIFSGVSHVAGLYSADPKRRGHMEILSGGTLGPYEIPSAVGALGMVGVFFARAQKAPSRIDPPDVAGTKFAR
jgi:hypothetical protein